MGALCFCLESKPPEGATPTQIATFKNTKLEAKKFCYFGPILQMSNYQPKAIDLKTGRPNKNPWQSTRTNFTRMLNDLQIRTRFEHLKVTNETPGIAVENDRYNN